MSALAPSRQGLMSLKRVWQMMPVLVLLSAAWGWGQIAPNDFWWHIRTGQLILEAGQIPRTDVYTFTHTGDPWVYQAWLMQIGLYLVYRAGGAPLTLFIHVLLVVVGYVLLQRGLLEATRDHVRLASTLVIGAAVLGMEAWTVRPQGISIFLFGLTLFLLIRYRHRQGRVLWWLPLIFLVWVNAHGGFVFGLALCGSFVIGQIWDARRAGRTLPLRDLMLPVLLAAATLAANPVGPLGIINYVLGFARHPGTHTLNAEFRPLSVATGPGALFIVVVIMLVAVMIWRRRRPDVFGALALLIFGLLALWAERNRVWFGMAGAPVAAALLTSGSENAPAVQRGQPGANAMVLAILVGVAAVCLPWFRGGFPQWNARRGVVARATPIGATAYLCENLSAEARIFNDMSFGSYVIWGCPRRPVFIDTRFELYSLREWQEYLAIGAGRFDWQQWLDRRGITHLLLNPEAQAPLIAAAAGSPCWKEVYRDGVSVVFARIQNDLCPR